MSAIERDSLTVRYPTIKVEWRIHYVTDSGDEKQTVHFAQSPRVPRVGDYVDGLKVTRVEWDEDMESATIELWES